MVFYTKELHLFNVEKWAGDRISNDGPSYRAAEAPRATPCGLARRPCICLSETYQMSQLQELFHFNFSGKNLKQDNTNVGFIENKGRFLCMH
jgi:hypothetical protein